MDPATRRITARLAPLTNYERTRPDRPRFSLETARALAERLGPVPACAVQVGGSKGKGTVAAYLETLARSAGLSTGVYASPHVRSICERVRLDGRPIDGGKLEAAVESVLAVAAADRLEPSFFEVMTAAALASFVAAGVDLAVFEVGLGGRLDATTAIPVDGSILTGVELEHTEILGSTVEAIAAEKAHIARPGRPVWTAATGPALAVVESHARSVGAPLAVRGRDFDVEDVVETELGGWRGSLRSGGERAGFGLGCAPRIETVALALAWACLRELRPDLDLDLTDLPRPALPGRFEVVDPGDGRPLVLDGAHTEESHRILAAELARRFPGQRCAVLYATATGKRWREGLSWLSPVADRFHVTGLSGTRSADPVAICEWLTQSGTRARAVPDVASGLGELLAFAGVRVVTGSFYLVGEVAALCEGAPRDP